MVQINPKHTKIIITVFVLVCALFFLFFRLGHYALWDDEADTALFAKSVWRTGDTHAMLDHNLIAHTYGQELKGLRNRYIPPLAFYLAAPFIGLSSQEAPTFAARLPFAICGFLTVVMMLFWLWKSKASVATWLLTAAGILGNVSLMLYARQCRYYSPAILATTVLAFLYVYRDRRKRTLLSIALVSLLLLASNYMFYVAVYASFVVDYFVWGRKKRAFRKLELILVFIPQIIFGGFLTGVYDLLGKKAVGYESIGAWLSDRGNMLYWNLRELNSCEHGVGILILIAPLLYLFVKDRRLLRGSAVVFMFVLVVTLLSPRPFEGYDIATVRYLAPVIPICIFTAVVSIEALTVRAKWLALPIAVLAFGTNVLHGGPLVGIDKKTMFSQVIAKGRFRSTVADFVAELLSPPPSTYRITADWIDKNLKDKDTVWVMPAFATYPLMYHSPKVMYAWQLYEDQKSGQFENLPDIHFMEKIPPDYVIAFGPQVGLVWRAFERLKQRDVHYTKIKQIDRYWYDLIRPELFWHTFFEVRDYSPESQAIYIYKLDP